MQKLTRLDDLLEHDAERIDEARRGDKLSHFQEQIDATVEDIRKAFKRPEDDRHRIRAKVARDV